MTTIFKIAPSLLSANLMSLGHEIDAVLDAGADMIHLDIMDNHYVPNLTFGPDFCAAIRARHPNVVIDVHLMVTPVDALIEQFAKAGASRLSIHPDATIHLDRSLNLIKSHGIKAGLVLNPSTTLDALSFCDHLLDFVLVMTVNPGFGGQKLIEPMYKKIEALHQAYPKLAIAVDGGVTLNNLKALAEAGATEFIAGSSVFGTNNYNITLQKMRDTLTSLGAQYPS